MRAKQPVVCVVTLLLVGDVAARAKPSLSSVEMLEFIGNYETVGGGGCAEKRVCENRLEGSKKC